MYYQSLFNKNGVPYQNYRTITLFNNSLYSNVKSNPDPFISASYQVSKYAFCATVK